MGRNKRVFYANEVVEKGNPIDEKEYEREPFDKKEFAVSILNRVDECLDFLHEWYACPSCGVVFEIPEGKKRVCPVCSWEYYNDGGSLTVKRKCEKEEFENKEEVEKSENKEEFFDEIEIENSDFLRHQRIQNNLNGEDNRVLRIDGIGEKPCPVCGEVIDWDKIEPSRGGFRNLFQGVFKVCPKCEENAFVVDEDDGIWMQRNLDEEDKPFYPGEFYGEGEG